MDSGGQRPGFSKAETRRLDPTEQLDGGGLVRVVVGCFKPFLDYGLAHTLRADTRIRVLARGLAGHEIEQVASASRLQVAILSDQVEYSILERLASAPRPLGVLILARHPTRLYETLLAAHGVSWLPLGSSQADVHAAVHLIAHGQSPSQSSRENRAAASGHGLTKRELEVLTYLIEGSTYATMAHALHIGVETARTHTRHICRKLDVRSKTDLIGMQIPPQSR